MNNFFSTFSLHLKKMKVKSKNYSCPWVNSNSPRFWLNVKISLFLNNMKFYMHLNDTFAVSWLKRFLTSYFFKKFRCQIFPEIIEKHQTLCFKKTNMTIAYLLTRRSFKSIAILPFKMIIWFRYSYF